MKKSVLNHGFIELVDMMGDDNRVLDAARVSTGASSKGEEKDRQLVYYLMKEKHFTPFEKIVFEFHISCPFFIARQWMRHRIGSYNEESARYRQLEFKTFAPDVWRKQHKVNHQASSEEKFTETEETQFWLRLDSFYEVAEELYEWYLKQGVARELARVVLPMGTYTEFYWTVNFRSLMNFLTLRSAPGAQFEIQEYARAIKELLNQTNKIPMSYKAFELYGSSL